MSSRIHMEPFEEGFRPYDHDPATVREWQVVKIPNLPVDENHFQWISEHTKGEFSITPRGMAFSEPEDAFFYKLNYVSVANEPSRN